MSETPEPDRIAGAPHPRETARLIGQDAAVAGFLDAYNAGRLHSGWLLTGPRGIGKATLAWKIATFLLATPPQDDGGLFGAPPAPGRLDIDPEHPDARLVQAGAHPRLSLIRRPADDKTGVLKSEITVDAVRGLKSFFHMSAADGGRRVVIVDAADEMNRAAANAILKELEEPPADSTILLVAHQPSRLLPTIRSRCRELRLAPLSPGDLAEALAQAGLATDAPEALGALSAGSVGDAVRLIRHDGLSLYAEIVRIFGGLPSIDRPALIRLAESAAGKPNAVRFALILDLFELFLSRLARAGLTGEPAAQGAPGEARLLTRLSPDAYAARGWADLQQRLSARARAGAAVNLDPAALILDMGLAIEARAGEVAPA